MNKNKINTQKKQIIFYLLFKNGTDFLIRPISFKK